MSVKGRSRRMAWRARGDGRPAPSPEPRRLGPSVDGVARRRHKEVVSSPADERATAGSWESAVKGGGRNKGETPGGRCMGTSAPGVSEDKRGLSPSLVKNDGWDPQETEGTEVSKDPYRHLHPQGLGRPRGVWAFCGVGRCGQDSGRRRDRPGAAQTHLRSLLASLGGRRRCPGGAPPCRSGAARTPTPWPTNTTRTPTML